MEPYQSRLADEKAELESKIDKLRSFLKGEAFTSLNTQEKSYLQMQVGIMQSYIYILALRMSNQGIFEI